MHSRDTSHGRDGGRCQDPQDNHRDGSPKTASAGDYHFSFLPELKHQMNAIAKYAKAQGIKSVGTLALDDDLGREGISELKDHLHEMGST